MNLWSAGWRLKRTSPSGPISDEAIIALRTYSSWSSKFWTIDAVRIRSSAKPPISSRAAIQNAATTIMRRVSDPTLTRLAGGATACSSAAAAVAAGASSFNRAYPPGPRACSRGREWW